MITRRNVLGTIALTAVPASAVAAIPEKVEVLPPSLEERLAAMSRDELEDYYMDRLMEIMNYSASDIFISPRRTAASGVTQVVLIDRRDRPGTAW